MVGYKESFRENEDRGSIYVHGERNWWGIHIIGAIIFQELDSYLSDKVYFVGRQPTLADIFVYYGLHRVMVSISDITFGFVMFIYPCCAEFISGTKNRFAFLPEASFGLRVLSLPASASVCVCVNPEVVHVKTHHLHKLEPLNSDQTWDANTLSSLLFWEGLTWTSRWNLTCKSKFHHAQLVH